MNRWWKIVVGVAVALPLTAYLVGTLVANADEEAPPRRPVLEMEAPERTGPPTPDGTTRSPGERRGGENRPGRPGSDPGQHDDADDRDDDDEVERIQRDPEDLDDRRDARRGDQDDDDDDDDRDDDGDDDSRDGSRGSRDD